MDLVWLLLVVGFWHVVLRVLRNKEDCEDGSKK